MCKYRSLKKKNIRQLSNFTIITSLMKIPIISNKHCYGCKLIIISIMAVKHFMQYGGNANLTTCTDMAFTCIQAITCSLVANIYLYKLPSSNARDRIASNNYPKKHRFKSLSNDYIQNYL